MVRGACPAAADTNESTQARLERAPNGEIGVSHTSGTSPSGSSQFSGVTGSNPLLLGTLGSLPVSPFENTHLGHRPDRRCGEHRVRIVRRGRSAARGGGGFVRNRAARIFGFFRLFRGYRLI